MDLRAWDTLVIRQGFMHSGLSWEEGKEGQCQAAPASPAPGDPWGMTALLGCLNTRRGLLQSLPLVIIYEPPSMSQDSNSNMPWATSRRAVGSAIGSPWTQMPGNGDTGGHRDLHEEAAHICPGQQLLSTWVPHPAPETTACSALCPSAPKTAPHSPGHCCPVPGQGTLLPRPQPPAL